MERGWVVVVPVKRLGDAKSRLSADVGVHRRDLALAMALDTIDVAASCSGVRVVVVTDDDVVTAALRTGPVRVVADEPGAGINAAVIHGARSAMVRPDEGVAALAADLPSLRTAELSLALCRAAAHPEAFVADAAGTGTTLYATTRYAATEGASFTPRFGAGSARAHAHAAARLSGEGLISLQRDVDTIDDLRAAARLGLHRHATAVVSRLGDVDLAVVRPAS